VVDLHLHTTASDGRLSPEELVALAAASGLRGMAVTDHDTTAAVTRVQTLAAPLGIEAISGIEITAVEHGRDLHVLGYFIDPDDTALSTFLRAQRQTRVARVAAIAERLAALGMPLDIRSSLEASQRDPGRTIGRPQVARAMVAAGYVADTREAFDRWLGAGRPGFVPRQGSGAEDVIRIVHAARGLASVAHPGKSTTPARIRTLREAGLDAIEVFHPDHDAAAVDQFNRLAAALGMLVTGGSDFHGDPSHGLTPGSVTLPEPEWQRLLSGWRR
jgi:predicted metal-dependent phosphoesterase TrpH